MQKLIQLELLQQKDMDALLKWKTKSGDSVRFNEFIAWWISCAAQDGIIESKSSSAAGGDAKTDSKTAAADKKAAAPGATASAGAAPSSTKPAAGSAASGGASGSGGVDRTKLIAPILMRLAAQRDEIKK